MDQSPLNLPPELLLSPGALSPDFHTHHHPAALAGALGTSAPHLGSAWQK